MKDLRLAVWSGPRNLSTALMYSFEQRADCAVWDEPFYGAYLAATGAEHPMRDEVLAACEQDAAVVARACAGPVPDKAQVFYQKHMAHHILPDMPSDWMAACTHVLMIRHPSRVLASYGVKRDTVTLEDIGLVQQKALLERLCADGTPVVVVDSSTIRANPARALTGLCAAVGLEFDPAMLSWPAGGSSSDGVWAPHWYDAVHKSTGFAEAEGPIPEIKGAAVEVLKEALPIYYHLVERATPL